METQNVQTETKPVINNTNTVPKRRAWVVVLSSVLLTLIIAGIAFGSYASYINTLKDREVKELNNSVENLKKELDGMKKSETNSEVFPTIKTYADNDLNFTFKYSSDLTLTVGELGQGTGKVEDEIVKSRTISLKDKNNNELVLTYLGGVTGCNSDYLATEITKGGVLVNELNDVKNEGLYRYENQYIYVPESDSLDDGYLCFNDTQIAALKAKFKNANVTEYELFDNAMKTLDLLSQ